MKRIRLLHLYLGVFFTPAIIFFSVTGALQTFGLHEAPRDGSYAPPAWLEQAGRVHMKQGLAPAPTPQAPVESVTPSPIASSTPILSPSPAPEPPPGRKPKLRISQPLKWFVLLMSMGLVATSLLGIYMALRYNRNPRLVWGLLLAGALLPVLMLLL